MQDEHESAITRGHARMSEWAGRVRIALALVGIVSTLLVEHMASFQPAFLLYLLVAIALQILIERRVLLSVLRALLMGIIDVAFLTFVVHQTGSVSSAVPLVYVVAPVLYATTTSRRRIPLAIAGVGVALYALVVCLELVGSLTYAPALPDTPAPDAAFALLTLVLVSVSALSSSALTSQLIRRLEDANARLNDLSQHDELTSLYNRRHVMQRLDDELARLARKAGALTVAMVDLDGFKRVNDEVGHEAGDLVLRAVARALLEATRKGDVVARYGGDEFVVLLPNTELEGAKAVGARMLDQSRAAARSACPSIPVSASIGATRARDGDDPAEILRRVDEQLYAAKRAGGDRVLSD